MRMNFFLKTILSVCKDVEQLEISYIAAGGDVKLYSYSGRSLGNFLQLNTHFAYDFYNPTIGISPTEMKTYVTQKTYTRALSSLIHNHPKRATPQMSSGDGRIKKLWLTCSGIFLCNNKEGTSNTQNSINLLEGIVLNKTSECQKAVYCVIPCI